MDIERQNRGDMPTRASIIKALEHITGPVELTPEQRLLGEISERVTVGMREADAMKTELYIMDIINAVKGGQGREDEELLGTVKGGRSFRDLNTVFRIPDSTTLDFINEVREKLADKPQS